MPFLFGKQAFLQILKQEGVEIMFGNPGTTELPLMDASLAGRPRRAVREDVGSAPALQRGLASGGPYLLDVRIDGSFKA